MGEAHLENDRVTFRGDFRLNLAFKTITNVGTKGGTLTLVGPDGRLALELGSAAEGWAERIRNPKSRVDKLGVKPGSKVTVLGLRDEVLEREIRAKTSDLSRRMRQATDTIILGVERTRDLGRLGGCREKIAQNGAIWVVYPKGRSDITQADVMEAGKQCGLVDIKIVKFSETHTALKFVIPVAQRSGRVS